MYCSDYHLHTLISSDSPASLEQQVRSALEAGLNELCVTDHWNLLGQQGKPVILCRHPGSTVRELLYAAEHVRPLGERVFFCLGPVHTAGGPVLDLDAVAQLRQFSPVPVLAATRQRGLELAAIAAGAEGLLLEADDLNEHQITLLRHQITAMKGLCHKPAGLKSMKHPRILWE